MSDEEDEPPDGKESGGGSEDDVDLPCDEELQSRDSPLEEVDSGHESSQGTEEEAEEEKSLTNMTINMLCRKHEEMIWFLLSKGPDVVYDNYNQMLSHVDELNSLRKNDMGGWCQQARERFGEATFARLHEEASDFADSIFIQWAHQNGIESPSISVQSHTPAATNQSTSTPLYGRSLFESAQSQHSTRGHDNTAELERLATAKAQEMHIELKQQVEEDNNEWRQNLEQEIKHDLKKQMKELENEKKRIKQQLAAAKQKQSSAGDKSEELAELARIREQHEKDRSNMQRQTREMERMRQKHEKDIASMQRQMREMEREKRQTAAMQQQMDSLVNARRDASLLGNADVQPPAAAEPALESPDKDKRPTADDDDEEEDSSAEPLGSSSTSGGGSSELADKSTTDDEEGDSSGDGESLEHSSAVPAKDTEIEEDGDSSDQGKELMPSSRSDSEKSSGNDPARATLPGPKQSSLSQATESREEEESSVHEEEDGHDSQPLAATSGQPNSSNLEQSENITNVGSSKPVGSRNEELETDSSKSSAGSELVGSILQSSLSRSPTGAAFDPSSAKSDGTQEAGTARNKQQTGIEASLDTGSSSKSNDQSGRTSAPTELGRKRSRDPDGAAQSDHKRRRLDQTVASTRIDRSTLLAEERRIVQQVTTRLSTEDTVVEKIRLLEVVIAQLEDAYNPNRPRLHRIPIITKFFAAIIQGVQQKRWDLARHENLEDDKSIPIGLDTRKALGLICCCMEKAGNNDEKSDGLPADTVTSLTNLHAAMQLYTKSNNKKKDDEKGEEKKKDLLNLSRSDLGQMKQILTFKREVANLFLDSCLLTMFVAVGSNIVLCDLELTGDDLETAKSFWAEVRPDDSSFRDAAASMSLLTFYEKYLLPSQLVDGLKQRAIELICCTTRELAYSGPGIKEEKIDQVFKSVQGKKLDDSEGGYGGDEGHIDRRNQIVSLNLNLALQHEIPEHLPRNMFPNGFAQAILTNKPSYAQKCNFHNKEEKFFGSVHGEGSTWVRKAKRRTGKLAETLIPFDRDIAGGASGLLGD